MNTKEIAFVRGLRWLFEKMSDEAIVNLFMNREADLTNETEHLLSFLEETDPEALEAIDETFFYDMKED